MRTLPWMIGCLCLAPASAWAQDALEHSSGHRHEALPEAPQRSAEATDDEVIRWAAREVGGREGRGNYPPLPPDPYLSHGQRPTRILGESNGQIAVRLVAEAGGGSLGLLLGGGVGALLVLAAVEGRAGSSWVAAAVGTAMVLGSLGLTGGVTLAGDLVGGEGNFGLTFIGQVIGAVVSLPIVAFAQANDALALSLVAGGLLPLAGAILGYEIGHSDRSLSVGARAYVTPLNGGALAGLAGSLP